uniref:P-type Ca(2+) transporter n=1 Tax=Oryza sativa TaxID=4530 RepID=O04938_ORYSA|nr:Ca2+-ATPase [Oryza sativa Indica Group]
MEVKRFGRSSEEVLNIGVNETGLSIDTVKCRKERYGLNELFFEEGKTVRSLVLEQFHDILVKILLNAAYISFVLAYIEEGEAGFTAYVEPIVIFLILIVNPVVGVWQESNAEKALEALKEIQSEHATVKRDGRWSHGLPARDLVPGDIVELRVGDKVPADMRVLQLISSTLRVEQGSLTGETASVNKTSHKIELEDTDIQGKECMVFAGTTIVNGSAVCVVTGTGMDTEIGKIHAQIQEASQEEDDTPLKKKLNEFGEALTAIIGVICALVWLINVKYFLTWEYVDGWPRNFKFSFEKCTYYFEIAVALAVAAIPEGLPAVITTCLALATRKMSPKNALVRKLPSVETLGCTTVICSDKTGTLTTNQMSAVKLVAIGRWPDTLRSFKVDGTTYDPSDGKINEWPSLSMDENLQMIAKIAAVCNDASIAHSEHQYVATGMPTEAASDLLSMLISVICKIESVSIICILFENPRLTCTFLLFLGCCQWWNNAARRVATLEFDRTRKSMGVIVKKADSGKNLLLQGAVENLLERSGYIQLLDGSVVLLDEGAKALILSTLREMVASALRCLGFAYKEDLGGIWQHMMVKSMRHKYLLDPSYYSSIESNLIFCGFVGLRDPPREEVHKAIEDCRAAGIRVMVVTGDNKETAEAICREIGVFCSTEDISSKSFTGEGITSLSDKKKLLRQTGGLLFSRAEPKHKQEIVRLLKEDGESVAMTGDGANHAPALKLADLVFFLMYNFCWVPKEASDTVLADDNFSTIVAAVGEGRSIYDNMRAFIRYMISSNIGEVASIFLTSALGIPEGLIPVQLLWVNLVTDGPPATALGFIPPDKDIMKKPPRRSDDSLITPWILFRYMVIGMYVGIATVGVFIIWYTHGSFLGIRPAGDGHSLVSDSQLPNWGQCSSWEGSKLSPFTAVARTFNFDVNPCDYFQGGKIKATTLSCLSSVAIEMFNSLNALSEDGSLLSMPPWVNPWLLLAMSVSFGLHFLILYVPFLAQVFGIVPLSFNEWLFGVIAVAFPVALIDEVLKFVGRCLTAVPENNQESGRKIRC